MFLIATVLTYLVASETSSEESTTSTFTPETIVTTRTSILYTSVSSESTSIVPITSDGTTGFVTVTTVVIATSAVGTYTEASSYTTTPTALAGSEQVGGSSGLSSGAKAGIGVGVALAVLLVAAFGFWFSWYQRRRRRRSLAASEQYPPVVSTPEMTYGSGGRDYSGGGSALAGGVGYTERSETRSELPSPPLGSPDPLLGGMGGRAPDRLSPAAAGPISWGSGDPHSNPSVSDYSDYGGQQGVAAGAAGLAAGAGVAGMAGYQQRSGHGAHELPENQQAAAYGGARTLSNGSQNQYSQHQRTFSGSSQQHGPYAGAVSPQTGHSRTMSDSSTHAQNYHMSIGSDNPYAAELHSNPSSAGQAAELEGNLQQRMDFERKPVRPGHFLTKNKGDIDPSQNF